MTEMAFELQWIITDTGGLRHSDINVLNHNLRRMLWNRGDYTRPIELVNKRHTAQPAAGGTTILRIGRPGRFVLTASAERVLGLG